MNLLSSFGIVLSALIASTSVMKSIENSKELDKEKRKEEKENANLRLAILLKNLHFMLKKTTIILKTKENEHLYHFLKESQKEIFKDKSFFNIIEPQKMRGFLLLLQDIIIHVKVKDTENKRYETYRKQLLRKIEDFLEYPDIKKNLE